MNKQVIIKEYNGEALNLYNVGCRKFCQEEIGRKDIIGNPIREGDIITVHNKIEWGGVVIYNEKGCGFCFESEDMGDYVFGHGWGEGQQSYPEKSWEKVGSIYGN